MPAFVEPPQQNYVAGKTLGVVFCERESGPLTRGEVVDINNTVAGVAVAIQVFPQVRLGDTQYELVASDVADISDGTQVHGLACIEVADVNDMIVAVSVTVQVFVSKRFGDVVDEPPGTPDWSLDDDQALVGLLGV